MKKTKLFAFLLLCFFAAGFLAVIHLPTSKADSTNGIFAYHDYASGNSADDLSAIDPASGGYVSACGVVYQASYTGSLTSVTVEMQAVNQTAGYTTATIGCRMEALTANSLSGVPNGVVLATAINTNAINQRSSTGAFSSSAYAIYTFNFNYPMAANQYYDFIIYVISINVPQDSNHFIAVLTDSGDTSQGLLYHSSQWYGPTVTPCFYAYGNNGIGFNGYISGGLFAPPGEVGAYIAPLAPTQTTLEQGVTYTYTGNIYLNSALQGDGNYTVEVSALSTSTGIFSAYSYVSSISGNVSGGVFTFSIDPVTALATEYQVMTVSFLLTDGHAGTYTYDLGYYAPGSSVYPTSGPTTTPTDLGASGAVGDLITMFLPLFILGIVPLIGAVYAGFAGMLIGWNAAGVIDTVTGMFPFYVIIVVVLTDVVALYMRPQIETSVFHRNREG
jgi:hypothetical protein